MQDVDFMLHQLIADSAFFICYSQVPVSNIVTSSVITPYPVNYSFIYDPVPISIQLAYALQDRGTELSVWFSSQIRRMLPPGPV